RSKNFEKIRETVRKHLSEFPELLIYPTVTAQFASDLLQVGIITLEERRVMVRSAVELALSSPVSPEIATLICSDRWSFLPPAMEPLQSSEFQARSPQDPELLRTLNCLIQAGAASTLSSD
ncbi:MAG: hypothetical protein AAB425_11455, partial [Bdellovibrionota bacterium]